MRALLYTVCAGILAANVALAARYDPGASQIPGSVTPPPSGAVVNTIQLCSTSGSTVAANTPSPPMFALEFKKGDVPAGQWPLLESSDGMPWPATFINKRSWSDGSMKIVGVLTGPFPKAVPTTCVTANVRNGGTAPAASGLTAAQMYSEQIALSVNGFTGALGTGLSLQGNWQSLLKNDANKVEEVDYGDGGGGRVYRVLTHVESGGTPHGQMEVYWYVQQLKNASGGLAGYRVMPRLTQPWYNHDTPAKDWRGLQTFNVQYGSRPTRVTPPFSPTSMDMPSSGWQGGDNFTITSVQTWCGKGLSTCKVPGYVTTTGTLPTGLGANMVYCANVDSSPKISFFFCGDNFGGAPNITNGGTGTHTFNPIPLLPHFGTLWGADANGRYLYVQGSGSAAADAPILIKGNATYDQSTRVWPPYNMSLNPLPDPNNPIMGPFFTTPIAFDLMTTSVIPTHLDGGGERDPIGIRTGWCARWFYNRTLVDDKYIRVLGLGSMLFGNSIRDFTTHGLLNLGDPSKSYTGMSSATNSYTGTSLASTIQWDNSSLQLGSGGTLPLHGGASILIDANNTSHMPDLAGCAYLATGEPQYLDLQMEWANDGIYTKDFPLRNTTLGGVNYYGVMTNGASDAIREMAWGLRPIVDADAWCPDIDPAGTQICQYLHYQEKQSTAFAVATVPLESTAWARNNCYWQPPAYFTRPAWHMNYMNNVLVDAYNADEDANALTMMQCNATWYQHILATFGSGYILYDIADFEFDVGNLGNPVSLQSSYNGSITCAGGTATLTATQSPHIGLFTGEVLNVSAIGYNGTYAVTRTGADSVTFPVTCAGNVSAQYSVVAQLNASDATFGAGSTSIGLYQVQWLSGTPGSFSLTYYDYSPGNGPGGQSWNPANGDKFIFKAITQGVQPGTAPGGLTFNQPYYTVNTHAGAIGSISWSSGTLTITTAATHGITLGSTVSMGITGSDALGGNSGTALNCTITSTTQFTCPLASNAGPSTTKGNYNTSQLATSPGGTPLAITDSNLIQLDFANVPANPPAGYWVDFSGFAGYNANAWGAAGAMIASGVTGLSAYYADAEARMLNQQVYFNNGSGTTFNGPGSTRAGTLFRAGPKNAMQTSFGITAGPLVPGLRRR